MIRRNSVLILLIMLMLTLGVAVLAQDDARPLYELPTGQSVRTSGSMALRSTGRVLVVANMLNNTVSLVDPVQGSTGAEVHVGRDPRSVALTPDDSRALVVNRRDGTLSVLNIDTAEVEATFPVGVLPYAVVVRDNERAYVSVQGSSEIIEIDIFTGQISQRIATPDSPAGLALWGDFLYVTHLWSGDFSLIYLPDGEVVRTISTGAQTSLSQGLAIDTETGIAYLPQSRSNAQDQNLTYDNTILPIINQVDLSTMNVRSEERIDLLLAGLPVNMPFAVYLDSPRDRLYVVNAGSNDVSVIDLTTGFSQAKITVGANPRGIVFSRDAAFAYVHNAIDGTVTVIETRNLTIRDVVPVSNITIPIDVLIGAQLFNSAADSRLSTHNLISCANCHFDGLSDGRTWLGKNTPVLYDLSGQMTYTWSGNWDELSDVELHIRQLQTGTGLIDDVVSVSPADSLYGLSLDLDALTAYLTTLQGPENPLSADPDVVERGEMVFNEQGCAGCHSGASGSDGMAHDVATGGEFITPPLRYLWLSAPYFHDGSAAALEDVFQMPGDHRLIIAVPDDDIAALVTYLLSRP